VRHFTKRQSSGGQSVFLVGLTPDLFNSKGEPTFGPAPMATFAEASGLLRWEVAEPAGGVVTPAMLEKYDALYINTPKVTAESFNGGSVKTRVIARHGVGYDSVDVPVLTRHGVVLTNTPLAIRRPVAAMALTYMLALGQRMMAKDRLTRTGRWNERNDFMGRGLTGRTLGLVGVGGIAKELARLVAPFEMRVIGAGREQTRKDGKAVAPFVDEGVERVDLATVLREADYLVLATPLDDSTRHLIGAAELALMKPTAYLINVARGPVVDEAALIAALTAGRIAGAGLDVFEVEPVPVDNPLLKLDNVIVSPHSLCWTDETFEGIARGAMTSVVDMLSHRRPAHIVNPAVLRHPRVAEWLAP
jgi:D-3-phosphoglycerate dehydrogenase